MGPVSSLRPWQILILIVALLGAGGGTFGVYLMVTRSGATELEENQQIVPVQRGDLINQISISGTLSLPSREVLRFGSAGVVDEVLIEEGQRVAEGDVLARLDEDTIASLDKGVVQARVDVRDAEDALNEHLEPMPALEVARAEQQVASAEFALRVATESLEDLVNPADLLVAEANARVASSRLALDSAQEALDEMLEPSTDLEQAQARTKVANARLDLENAQEALDEMLEPPTDLEQAQAQAKVANAQTALQTAEDALETLLEPTTYHQVAEGKANIAAKETAVKNTEDALEDFWAGVSDDDLADAHLAVETAMTLLANSRSDLAVVERRWDTKTSAAADTLADSADAYSEMFVKWLGVRIDRKSLDPDYEAALSRLGVDLQLVFDPSNRATDLRADETLAPPDDPATSWNELTVFTWLSFSPMTIAATCDPGDPPYQGRCVEEEFRTAAGSYQAEMDNWDSLQAERANALTGAESAVRTAQNALDKARETLEDLEGPLDLIVGEDLEAKFNLATAELERAWEDLEEMLEPADAVALSDQRARVDLATAELNAARDDLARLTEPGHPAEIADQRAQIALAQQNLKEAMEDLESLVGPVDETTTVANQRHQVALAQLDVEKAESDLRDLLAGMEQTEYQAKLQEIEGARLDLEERKQELQDLLADDKDSLDVALLEANIASARVALGQAEQRLDDAIMTAPWDGFVSQVNVEAGEEVEPSTNIMVVVDTSVVEIDGLVDEIDVLSIELGAEAVVTVDALPGQTIKGEVSFLASEPAGSQSGQGVVGYPVRVRLDLPPGLQTPQGLSAVASIVISQELDVLLLPITAIHGSFTEPTVNLMVDGQVVETPVTLGSSDDFWTVVTDGVSEGDMIVMISPDDSEFGGFGGPRRGRRNVTVGP